MVPGADASGLVAPRRALKESIMLEIGFLNEVCMSDLVGGPGEEGK